MIKDLLRNERYSRHTSLKEFGEEGQRKIRSAKVLVIGAGGLGCPALEYLAGAGVGVIGIADHDVVSVSNLHRQMLYTTADTGLFKAVCAADRLKALNPDVIVHTHCMQVTNLNALELVKQYDIVVDGTDNFAARYVINDACVLQGKPLVYAGIYKYEGQLSVFNVADERGVKTNYRHLFPNPPSAAEAPSCRETGVLNVLPGIMGVMQAAEVIKLITGTGNPLINRLLTWNVLTSQSYTVQINATALPAGLMPESKETFRNTRYEWICRDESEIDEETFTHFLEEENVLFIDVREPGESPVAHFAHLQVPLSELKREPQAVRGYDFKKMVVFCQSGGRSSEAAGILRKIFAGEREIYSLAGGILGLKRQT